MYGIPLEEAKKTIDKYPNVDKYIESDIPKICFNNSYRQASEYWYKCERTIQKHNSELAISNGLKDMAIQFANWCMQNVSQDNDNYYDVQLNVGVVGGLSYRSIKVQSMDELYNLFLDNKTHE